MRVSQFGILFVKTSMVSPLELAEYVLFESRLLGKSRVQLILDMRGKSSYRVNNYL
jgi:hypothetical protein